jgi:hypothetical protein
MRLTYHLVLGVLGVVMLGCGGEQANVPCDQDSNCDLTAGGRCLAASPATGSMWCAYPDPDCPAGYRYSNQSVGDGLSGTCVPDDGSDSATIQVSVDGPGSVTSDPPGLACSAGTCSASFPKGTQVHLAATATSESFLGWSGTCRGISECTVALTQDVDVGAWFGSPGTSLWAVQLGGVTGAHGYAIVHDSHDDLIVAGTFQGDGLFGSTTLTSAGGFDIFVAKLAQADGSVVWVKQFGSSAGELVTGLAVDDQDAVYVSGSTGGTPDFGAGPLPNAGGQDILLFKLSSAGDVSWAKSFGTSGSDQGTAVAARNGEVAIAGYYYNASITIDGTVVPAQGYFEEALVALFSSDGELHWAKGFGGTSADKARAVRIDTAGNVVAAGEFQQAVNFGLGQSVSAGNTDAFVLKLSASDGATLVAKRFGAEDRDSAAAVDVDATDAMFVVGEFRHTVDFGLGGVTASNANNPDVFLLKLSAAGASEWANGYGGAGNGHVGSCVSVDLSNDVVFGGYFQGDLTLDGATISSAGQDDLFLARVASADGAGVSLMRAGGPGEERADAATQTSDGKYFATGAFNGFADFGSISLTSSGSSGDAYVFGMAPL